MCLQYVGAEVSDYPNIFDHAKTDVTPADQRRLIGALEKLSSGQAAEAVDVEQVIRYFAVHSFVCNDDSYTGVMAHNYYLYEAEGRLAMIPWDYNLAFGGFGMTDAGVAVNEVDKAAFVEATQSVRDNFAAKGSEGQKNLYNLLMEARG